MLAGLEVVAEISLRIEAMHDVLVAPEVDRDGFQSGKIWPEIRDGGILHVTQPVMLQNFAVLINEEHPFVARGDHHPRFGLRIGTEFHHRDAIGVILDRVVERPKLLAVVIEAGVADEQLVLAIAVHIVGKRIVAGVALRLPQQFQFFIEYPEAVLTVFEHDIASPALASEIAEVKGIAQDSRRAVARGRSVGGRGGRLNFVFCLPRPSISDDEFDVLAVNHLVSTVTIKVVNLKRDVIAQMVLPRIRFADLPEFLSDQIHRRETTDLAVRILRATTIGCVWVCLFS